MGGLVVTEQVFNLNGLGLLFVQAVAHRDYTLIQALVMLVAGFFIVVNFCDGPHVRVARSAHPVTGDGGRRARRATLRCAGPSARRRSGRPRRWPLAAGRATSAGRGRSAPSARSASSSCWCSVGAGARCIAPYDPLATDFGAMLAPPSAAHWLGTDAFGRDVLSRLIYGSRTALLVGFGASFLGATLGAVIGVASAYFGGRIDLLHPAGDGHLPRRSR